MDEDVGQLLDVGRVTDALGRGAIVTRARDHGVGERDLGVEDVASDLEERGAVRTVERLPERHRHHVRDPFGRHHARGELGDRLHHVDVRKVLERPHLVLVEGALTADQQHRALGTERVGNAGDGVGRPRAGRHDRAAGFPGHPRVAVGSVCRHLLVTDVDDLDAFIGAAVVDVDDMAAAEGEDDVDPLVLEGLGNEVTAGDRRRGLVGIQFGQVGGAGRGLSHGGSPIG